VSKKKTRNPLQKLLRFAALKEKETQMKKLSYSEKYPRFHVMKKHSRFVNLKFPKA